ncbi:MAG: hypothetical protein ACXWGY_04820 [Chthoniobacterales bacterium]
MRRSLRLTSACAALFLIAAGAIAKQRPPKDELAALPTAPPTNGNGMNVLILGDSLALCGFGQKLDERFRNDPQVRATFTYMACGTNPLSWLKEKPYTSIRALCGYWSIESIADAKKPREIQDTYGMTRGHVPIPHPVPKLEDLLAAQHPDILVVQTGSNLFGLFPDAKTVHPAQHAAALRTYFLPFKERAIAAPSTLKKIYWLSPPTSGRVSKGVQDFIFEETRKELGSFGPVIDSRMLVSYPYKHMDPDKEHFLGDDMNLWADNVFGIIQRDLAAQPLASLPPLSQATAPILAALPVQTPAPVPTPMPRAKEEPLVVKATLVFKSEPLAIEELMPYQESLVAYVYDVDKVARGNYSEKQLLVMQPSFIGLKPQRLDKFRIGKRYKLKLHPLEGTLWETAKASDQTGKIDLQPYIKIDDLKRHPGNRTR